MNDWMKAMDLKEAQKQINDLKGKLQDQAFELLTRHGHIAELEATLETMAPFLNRLIAVFDKEKYRRFDEQGAYSIVYSPDGENALDAFSAFKKRKGKERDCRKMTEEQGVTQEQKEASEPIKLDIKIALAEIDAMELDGLGLSEFEKGFLMGRRSVLRRLKVDADEIIKKEPTKEHPPTDKRFSMMNLGNPDSRGRSF